MKQLKLLMLMILVSLFIPMSSCGDKDEFDNSIIGYWSCSNHYYGGTDTFSFKKGGKYTWSYKGEADWFESQNGTYTFNRLSSLMRTDISIHPIGISYVRTFIVKVIFRNFL